MPVLDDERYETFAQQKALGKSNREAYEACGYGTTNIKSTYAAAGRLMMDPRIKERIKELQASAAEDTGVTICRVLQGWVNIGFADIRDTVTWKDGSITLKDSADLTAEQAAAIAEISESDKGALKVKFHNKVGALDSMAKFLGMFKEIHQHTGADGGPIEIKDDVDLARRIAFILARAGAKDG